MPTPPYQGGLSWIGKSHKRKQEDKKSRSPDGPHRGGGGGSKIWISAMQKSGVLVTRDVVLIKGDHFFGGLWYEQKNQTKVRA